MIRLESVTLRRGTEVLLRDADLTVHAGQKIGLVGANGTGKSSLFAALLGRIEVDAGKISMPTGWTVAHMAQQIDLLDRCALDHVLDGDARLRRAERAVAEADASGDGEQIALAHQQLHDAGGLDAHARAAALLNGLGFDADSHQAPVGRFSGGWRIRLSLARALMTPSDLLLLDEPTNHLDLETIVWLENWLKRYAGTLILISHDRDVLDNVVESIAQIEHQALTRTSGGYSEFERQRAEQMKLQQARFEKQQQKIAHMRAFVDRFRAQATKARQAQARLKALERMEEIAPAHADSPFDFQFPEPGRAADPLIRLEGVALGYGNRVVLDDVSLNLSSGDRIGLLGVNGAGKSTLVKALAGSLDPITGRLERSRNLEIGYFAQHQLEQIEPALSPIENLGLRAENVPEQKLRDFLGSFAFSGDLATDPCARLSGGERARLVLAMILWSAPNLLLLDEPTNHLDLEMRHALTLALQGFSGAVVTVSHDRHLLSETVDEYWLVAGQQVRPWKQGLSGYHEHVRASGKERRDDTGSGSKRRAERQRRAAERERNAPLTRRIRELTGEIEHLEQRKAELADRLADPALYGDRGNETLQTLVAEDAEIAQRLSKLEREWMEAEEQLEAG